MFIDVIYQDFDLLDFEIYTTSLAAQFLEICGDMAVVKKQLIDKPKTWDCHGFTF